MATEAGRKNSGTDRATRSRAGLLMTALPTLWLVASPAHGQSHSAAQAEATPPAVEASDDIVVTATRSAEPLSKVPISVTALSAEQLDQRGIRNIDDVIRFTPGVSFTRGLGPTSSISIRGVSSNSGAATTGVYLNDTPIQTRRIGQGGTVYNAYPTVFDLERVEVLRGPQGTLFGAGSEGGTVRFITPQPDLSHASLYARSELASTAGGDPSYEAGAAVGVPLIEDKLAARVSGYYRRDGGFIDRVDPTNGNMLDRNTDWQSTTAIRGAVTAAPVETVKITPSIFYQRTFANNKSADWEYLSDRSDDAYRTGGQLEEPTRDRLTLPALDISVDLHGATLFSNSSYLDRQTDVLQNFSNFIPAVIGQVVRPGVFVPGFTTYRSQGYDRNTQKSFTQELRLQSSDADARLRWVVGLFYQRSRQTAIEVIPETQSDYDNLSLAIVGRTGTARFGPLATSTEFPFAGSVTTFNFINRVRATDTQFAGFADVTFRLTDALSVSAGARVADVRFSFNSFSAGPYAGNSVTSGNQKERPVTPKFNVSYQADTNNLVYATASKGYRVGGANAAVSSLCTAQLATLGYTSPPTTYNSDSVWSYELGTKNAWFDRRLRVAASAYLIDWSNIQQSVYLPSCGNSFVGNVGKARSKGFDLSLELHPTHGFTLNTAIGYNDARYTRTSYGGATASGVRTIIVDKGNSLPATPWLVAVGGVYDARVFEHDAYLRVDYTYKSADPDDTPIFDPATTGYIARAFQNPASQLVNGRIGMRLRGLDLSVFVNNLFDTHTSLARVNLSPVRNQIDEFVVQRPRTVGITAAYRM